MRHSTTTAWTLIPVSVVREAASRRLVWITESRAEHARNALAIKYAAISKARLRRTWFGLGGAKYDSNLSDAELWKQIYTPEDQYGLGGSHPRYDMEVYRSDFRFEDWKNECHRILTLCDNTDPNGFVSITNHGAHILKL